MEEEVFEVEVAERRPAPVLEAGARLAVAQAVHKAVSAMVKTGTAGNLRSALDERLLELYEDTGAKALDLRVGGRKVGSVSLLFGKGPVVADREAFEAWALGAGMAREEFDVDLATATSRQRDAVVRFARSVCPSCVTRRVRIEPGWERRMSRVGDLAVTEDGEAVPGLAWSDAPASSRVNGCKPEDVAAALAAARMQAAVFGMLEGDA